MGVNRQRWEVELDGRHRTVDLEHRTWWHRAIVRVDGVVAANQSINLALGYDHAAGVSVDVDGHLVEVTIRADGVFRPTYRYAFRLDGDPLDGSDDVRPAPRVSSRPTLVGVTEQIIWASIAIAALRTLSISPLGAIALIPGAVIASWILRRTIMPVSWRLVGAVLATAFWVVASAALAGALDAARGL